VGLNRVGTVDLGNIIHLQHSLVLLG